MFKDKIYQDIEALHELLTEHRRKYGPLATMTPAEVVVYRANKAFQDVNRAFVSFTTAAQNAAHSISVFSIDFEKPLSRRPSNRRNGPR